jgi:hypothetical protein
LGTCNTRVHGPFAWPINVLDVNSHLDHMISITFDKNKNFTTIETINPFETLEVTGKWKLTDKNESITLYSTANQRVKCIKY